MQIIERKKTIQSLMQVKELSASEGAIGTSDYTKSRITEAKVEKSYLIEFEGITLTLKNGVTIMKNVSGSFKPGRLCAIMGPSGEFRLFLLSIS